MATVGGATSGPLSPDIYGDVSKLGKATKKKPAPGPLESTAALALSGLSSTSKTPVSTPGGALLNIGASTVTGAGSGALTGAMIGAAGGPIGAGAGALIGGGVALVASALDSWLQISSGNKERREMEKLMKEIEIKQSRREAQARKDELARVTYDRNRLEMQDKWTASLQKKQEIASFVNSNQSLKDRYLTTGVQNA
jgi:hypothetical protein